jgi:hypothetical protein
VSLFGGSKSLELELLKPTAPCFLFLSAHIIQTVMHCLVWLLVAFIAAGAVTSQLPAPTDLKIGVLVL